MRGIGVNIIHLKMKNVASSFFIILINFQSLADLGSLCKDRPPKQDAIIYVSDTAKKELINKIILNEGTNTLTDKEFEELTGLILPLTKKFIYALDNLTITKDQGIAVTELTNKYSLITVFIDLFAYNGDVFNFLWNGEKLSVAFSFQNLIMVESHLIILLLLLSIGIGTLKTTA
ncbi:MAG: hypothetical protein RCG15_07205 [Candidatus Rickettsia vulgarisii]